MRIRMVPNSICISKSEIQKISKLHIWYLGYKSKPDSEGSVGEEKIKKKRRSAEQGKDNCEKVKTLIFLHVSKYPNVRQSPFEQGKKTNIQRYEAAWVIPRC